MVQRLYQIVSIVLLCVGTTNAGIIDMFISPQKAASEAPKQLFMSPFEKRRKQLEELNKTANSFGQEIKTVRAEMRREDQQIRSVAEETQQKLKEAQEKKDAAQVKFLTQKLNKLNERLGYFVDKDEALTKAHDAIVEHRKVLKDLISFLENRKQEESNSRRCTYPEIKELRGKRENISERIALARKRKEDIVRQQKYRNNDLEQLKTEEAANKKKLDDLEKEVGQENGDELTSLQHEQLISLENAVLRTQQEVVNLVLRQLEFEQKLYGDKIDLLEYEKEQLNKRIECEQGRIAVEQKDINAAKERVTKERAQERQIKNRLNNQQSAKKKKLFALKPLHRNLEAEFKRYKDRGEEATLPGQITEARIEAAEAHMAMLSQQIDWIESQKELAEEKLELEKAQLSVVEHLYKLERRLFDKDSPEEWEKKFKGLVAQEEGPEGQIANWESKRKSADTLASQAGQTIDRLKERIEKIKKDEKLVNTPYGQRMLEWLSSAIVYYEQQISAAKENSLVIGAIIRTKQKKASQYQFLVDELESEKRFDIFKRAPHAISLDAFWQALTDAETYLKELFWNIPPKLFAPSSWWHVISSYFVLHDVIGLALIILFMIGFVVVMRLALDRIAQVLRRLIRECPDGIRGALLTITHAVIEVVHKRSILFALWLFVQLDILFVFKEYLGSWGTFLWYTDDKWLMSLFYFLSIPLVIMFLRGCVSEFARVNRNCSFIFFAQNLEQHYTVLMKAALFSIASLFWFRQAFLLFPTESSPLPEVISAAYFLIFYVAAVTVFLLQKDEFLALIPVSDGLVGWIRRFLDRYYTQTFLFLLFLLVLLNPYIGYANMAFLLMYAVPLSLLIVYGMFWVHETLRNYSTYWFLVEEDGEYVDRFDHAKAYYAIFIILTFLVMLFACVMLVAKIWGASDIYTQLYTLLQDKWVLRLEGDRKIGIIEFVTVSIFIAGGFLSSTLLDKFFLSRIFNILRMDLGIRNTISSILHYVVIILAVTLGFIAIDLGSIMGWALTGMIFGIGFAGKEYLSDVIAGLLILLERPVEIGSFIETSDYMGTVTKISARSLTIRNAHNKSIILPNNKFLNMPIINWTYGRTVGFDLKVTVTYRSNYDKVLEILRSVVEAESRILKNPPPIYRMEDLADNGMVFLVRAFTSTRRARDKWDIAGQLRAAILNAFAQNNIVIPYRQSIIYSRNDEEPFAPKFGAEDPIEIQFDDEKRRKQGSHEKPHKE